MVLQEAQQQRFRTSSCDRGSGSNTGGGGGGNRSSKKNKQKKPPQRGLGVAQLEKIRLEEQGKAQSPSGFITPLPQMHQPLVPFSMTASSYHSSLISPPAPIASITTSPELLGVPPPHELAAGLAMAPPTGSTAGHGCLPMLWNPLELVEEATSRRFDCCTPMKNDPSLNLSRPQGLSSRRQLLPQQLNLHTSLVNASLSPSSSGVSLQMEPPSNQIHTSSYNRPLWQEENRMVGIKRSWPFPFESISSPASFPCKFPPTTSSCSKLHELASMHGHETSKSEQRHINFREGSSGSGTLQVEWKNSGNRLPEKGFKENGIPVDGDFLTLGSITPSNHATPLISKSKQSVNILPSNYHENSEFNIPPYQRHMDDAILGFGSSAPPPFYSFLPMGPSSHEKTSSELRGEIVDTIDLNLKL